MPVVKVQTPDGRIVSVEVPEGATQEQVFAFVQSQQSQQAPQQPSEAQITPEQAEIVKQSEAKIQSLQGDLDRLNEVRNNPDALEQVFGGVEGFLALASAPVAAVASGIAGLVDAANPFAEQGAGAARQQQVQEALTFTPKLAGGRQAVGDVVDVIEGATDIGTGAVALTTAGIQSAITGNLPQAAAGFQRTVDQGVGETIGGDVAEFTGSPLLGSIARTIPDATLLATGLTKFKPTSKFGANIAKKTKPTEFKNLSPMQKQKLIAEEVRAGNPNINSVTQMVTEKGTIATSKASRVALKELKKISDDITATQSVSVLERMTEASKARVNKMLDNVKTMRDRPLSDVRPSDVLGESIAFRAQAVTRLNKAAGERIGNVVKSLKNKQVNIANTRQQFFKSMDELGVKFNVGEDGFVTPDFSRSKFIGGSQKDMNVLVNDLLKDNVGFEFAHNLKRSIRDNLSFDPMGTSKIGKGISEKILKDLSSGIDQVLDSTSKAYDNANIRFAKTIDIVERMQKMAGKDVDLFSDTASVTLADKAKRITSNATSRGVIGRDIKELDRVLKELGFTPKDDISSLIFATNEMDRIFNIAPPNSLKGIGLDVGKKLARGDIPIEETVGFIKKAFTPSEQKVFLKKMEVLRDLTKLKETK